MPDHKPPRLAGDERETLCALLQYQRESVVRKVEGLAAADAARSPLPSGTSPLWLVAHLAQAEVTWVEQRFAGLSPQGAGDADAATLDEALDAYRAAWRRVDAIVSSSALDDTCRADVAVPPVNLRWVLAHLLEETARHAGHADVLRELTDGVTGR